MSPLTGPGRRLRIADPGGWALYALLAYFVLVPLGAVIFGSVRTATLGLPGAFTTENLRGVVESPTLVGALRSTLIFATGSTALSLVLGGYLAWVTERTVARVRGAIYVLIVASLIVPGILTTTAWVLLLHQRVGILNGMLEVWGFNGPFNAYTMSSMIWADGSDGAVLPFLIIATALRSMRPELEQAAELSGAGRGRVLRTVTLPLLRPALLAAALLSFIRSVGTFAVPAAMGIPGGIRLFATEVYLQSRLFPLNANLSAAYALVHLSIALGALWLYRRVTRGDGRFVTVGGRGRAVGLRTGGNSRWVHTLLGSALVFIVVVLPLAVMIHTSFLAFYEPPSLAKRPSWTLQQYQWALSSGIVRRALRNNLIIGGSAALAAMLLAALIAWRAVRRPGRFSRGLDGLATLPLAIPGSVLALALLWWYLYLPLPLYATRWVLMLALVTTFLPYGARTVQAALLQVDAELEEASSVSGARWWTTFTRIVIPLVMPSILAAALYMISRSFKALALPALLSGPGGEVLPTVVYSLYTSGRYPELNAIGVLMTLLLAGITGAAALISRCSRPRTKPGQHSGQEAVEIGA